MTARLKIIVAVALVLVTLLIAFLYYRWEAEQRSNRSDLPALASLELEEQAAAETPLYQVNLYLYDPVSGKPGLGQLIQMSREIPGSESDELLGQQILNAVIRESPGILPPVARVLQVFLMEDGTAVVDLSRETAEQLSGGVTSELGILRALTRSLRENLPGVQRVRFLVDGEERHTLSGHVSLSQPFM